MYSSKGAFAEESHTHRKCPETKTANGHLAAQFGPDKDYKKAGPHNCQTLVLIWALDGGSGGDNQNVNKKDTNGSFEAVR